ncbi:MAG: ABC transporter ATP-binding protein [Alphaproteobacteria bacterium]|nr:ABC transporter ATP-binding protein [Alphaproteobacteria bacterium]MBL0717818.1 ABC transporter ATP-binding protein [Alphaproteobacteria bacterium]
MTNNNVIISVDNLSFSYDDKNNYTQVFQNFKLNVFRKEFIALVGRSGSGKSTLLHLLGMLDKPTSGSVFFKGKCISNLSIKAQTLIRKKYFGFVFQSHYLLQDLTVLENVMMPLQIIGVNKTKAIKEADKILRTVGLSKMINKYPNQISGGEQQRVAICRALVHKPAIVLADEPTGNLDKDNAVIIFKLLKKISKQFGATLIIATHDVMLSDQADRIVIVE